MEIKILLVDITFFLAINSITLLITCELIHTYCGINTIRLSKKRLKQVTYLTSFFFFSMAIIKIIDLLYY